MAETLQAADWSRYQPPHTDADFRRLKENGIELVIPGSWHGDAIGSNPHCKQDLTRARRNGLLTATYVVLDSPAGTGGADAVKKARIVCDEEWGHLSFVALDVEVPGVTVAEIAAAHAEVLRVNQRPVIYTAYWFWHDRFGNPTDFRHVPLWNAYYDQQPDFDFDKAPYGGWSRRDVIGEQWSGTTVFAGVEMDRNTFMRDFVVQEKPMNPLKLVADGQFVFLEHPAAGHYWYLRTGQEMEAYLEAGCVLERRKPTGSRLA